MSSFKIIKRGFNALSDREKVKILKEIYDFSKEMRMFLESIFSDKDAGDEFIRMIKKETVEKVYRVGRPGIPDGRKVNSIISKARKQKISPYALMELEKLAMRGFVEFLNEYGGGPESFDKMSADHLENYLELVKSLIESEEDRKNIFEEMRKYLFLKNNMNTDNLDDVFEEATGLRINRD